MSKAITKIAGMDLGDRFSHVWICDEGGRFIERARLRTTRDKLQEFFGGRERMRVAIEVGTQSPWVSRLLEDAGHEVIVANARKVRLIHGGPNKNDKLDAEKLGRLARVDVTLLHPVKHRTESEQRDLALVRTRAALVAARTGLINHVQGTAKSMGLDMPRSSTDAFCKRATERYPEWFIKLVAPALRSIAELCQDIHKYERQIATVSKQYPETERFQQVSGVGPITALVFRLVVQSPDRFPDARNVAAYLGLKPKQDQSGKTDKQLRITKAGDSYLRSLLVNASHFILGAFGEDSDIRRWGLELAARGGRNAKKRAIVAVARKLAVVLLSIWKSGQDYESLRTEVTGAQAAA